jgi:hypothetical protein
VCTARWQKEIALNEWMNTHRLNGDIIHVFQLLQTGFNWDPRVRIEHVADEPVHLREMQIICR